MSTRQHFTAELTRDGVTLTSATKFAWNSAIRASESLVRDYAHASGQAFDGEHPTVHGVPVTGIYRRSWYGSRTGELVMVTVRAS